MRVGLILRLCFGVLVAVAGVGVRAADLRVGTQNVPMLDPHFSQQDSNTAYNQHIYGALLDIDETGRLLPDLAESWTAVGDQTWRFVLRRGVVFHDGSAFVADDVIYSLGRVPNVPNNPSPYSGQLLGITEVKRVDDFTVDVVTAGYLPTLPAQLAKLHIMSRRVAEGRSTEDINQGRATIGTGPYRLVEVQGKERIVLQRFERYWGKQPDWERVEFRVLPNDSARTAALLAGDVDMIEFVPLQDAARLASTPGIVVNSGTSPRVMYLGLNVDPKLESGGGPNPMLDRRVRQAVSMSLNREGMVRSLLLGYGRTATQIGVPGTLGYLEELKTGAYEPDAARKLLAEAGFPNGFSTSVVCTNGRYIADAQVCQALGQMLSRIGLKVSVEAVPASVFFGRVRTGNNPAPLYVGAWSNVMGDMGYTFNNIFHTLDPAKKMGAVNRSGWSDAALDGEIDAALNERDAGKRLGLLRAAGARVAEATVLLPLFNAPVVVATKAGIRYDVGTGGSSEMTSAMRAHPQ